MLSIFERARLPNSHLTYYSATFSYGGGHHVILMPEKDPVKFAKVCPQAPLDSKCLAENEVSERIRSRNPLFPVYRCRQDQYSVTFCADLSRPEIQTNALGRRSLHIDILCNRGNHRSISMQAHRWSLEPNFEPGLYRDQQSVHRHG